MVWTSVASGCALLLLVCWALGAYSRLLRLRASVRKAFDGVSDALLQDAGWVLSWVDEQQSPSARWASAGAVAKDVQATLAPGKGMKGRPADAASMAALNAAKDVLLQAIDTLPDDEVQVCDEKNNCEKGSILMPKSEKLQHKVRLNACIEEFNSQVKTHNAAVQTFPASMLARALRLAPLTGLTQVVQA